MPGPDDPDGVRRLPSLYQAALWVSKRGRHLFPVTDGGTRVAGCVLFVYNKTVMQLSDISLYYRICGGRFFKVKKRRWLLWFVVIVFSAVMMLFLCGFDQPDPSYSFETFVSGLENAGFVNADAILTEFTKNNKKLSPSEFATTFKSKVGVMIWESCNYSDSSVKNCYMGEIGGQYLLSMCFVKEAVQKYGIYSAEDLSGLNENDLLNQYSEFDSGYVFYIEFYDEDHAIAFFNYDMADDLELDVKLTNRVSDQHYDIAASVLDGDGAICFRVGKAVFVIWLDDAPPSLYKLVLENLCEACGVEEPYGWISGQY